MRVENIYSGLVEGCDVDDNDQSYGLVFYQLILLRFRGLA